MSKRLVPHPTGKSGGSEEWLNIADVAVEITSEDPAHPIERALVGEDPIGWRASEPGVQSIRLLFDEPQDVRRIHLSFVEATATRTQEFVVRWAPEGESLREIVRQQWNFSPGGATDETEDYHVQLSGAKVIELTLNPNIGGHDLASLRRLRLA